MMFMFSKSEFFILMHMNLLPDIFTFSRVSSSH